MNTKPAQYVVIFDGVVIEYTHEYFATLRRAKAYARKKWGADGVSVKPVGGDIAFPV